MKRDKFNGSMDSELLKNDFKYYDDWKHGPQSGWSTDFHYFTLSLLSHDFGYWLIIHTSGEKPNLNIGSSNDAKEIIAIRDALKVLW